MRQAGQPGENVPLRLVESGWSGTQLGTQQEPHAWEQAAGKRRGGAYAGFLC